MPKDIRKFDMIKFYDNISKKEVTTEALGTYMREYGYGVVNKVRYVKVKINGIERWINSEYCEVV